MSKVGGAAATARAHKLPRRASFDDLPSTGYVREGDLVREHGGPLPFSSATLWRMTQSGRFPKPHKLAERVTAWRVADVRQWLANDVGGRGRG